MAETFVERGISDQAGIVANSETERFVRGGCTGSGADLGSVVFVDGEGDVEGDVFGREDGLVEGERAFGREEGLGARGGGDDGAVVEDSTEPDEWVERGEFVRADSGGSGC